MIHCADSRRVGLEPTRLTGRRGLTHVRPHSAVRSSDAEIAATRGAVGLARSHGLQIVTIEVRVLQRGAGGLQGRSGAGSEEDCSNTMK